MQLVLTQIHIHRKALIWGFIALNVMLAFLYAYCVNKTVFNAVALEKIQTALTQNASHYNELESNYIALKKNVTLEYAYAHGFKDAALAQKYITKKSLAQNFSFNAI